jgi:O-antigen/teichoic acid export membrane protein
MKQQIIKNVFSNYLLTGIGMVLAFFLVPFLIRKLGHEGFGVTVVAEGLILLFYVFVYAVRISVSRYVTLSLSQKKMDDCFLYLSTGKKILNVLMIWSFGAGIIVAIFFPIFFRVPNGLQQQSQAMFLLIVIAFVLSIPNVLYWSVLYGYHRFDLINFSTAGGSILRAAVIFILYSFLAGGWASLATYGVVYFVTTMGQNYIVYRWAKSLMPSCARIGPEYDRPKAKEILSYTRYTVLSTMSGTLYNSVMPVIINIFCGPTANTVYGVASRIPSVLKSIFLEPAWSLIPTCTHYVAQNERGKVEKLFFMYSKAVLVVLCPIIFSVAVSSKMILHWWVGEGFGPAISVMMILAVSALLSSFSYLCTVVTNAYGKIQWPTFVGIISAVASIGLGAFLAFFFKMGLPGLAIGSLLVTFAGSFLFSPIFTCHILKTDVRKYLMESFFVPMFLTLLSFGWELFFWGDVHFSMKFFSLMAVAALLYAWLVLHFVFNKKEKEEFFSVLRSQFGTKSLQGV